MSADPITDQVLNPDHDGPGSLWNAWPSLPIISVTEVLPTDSYAVHQFGVALGGAPTMRQVRASAIPHAVPLHKRDGARNNPRDMPNKLVDVHFTLVGPVGQLDTFTGRNVLALIPFPTQWYPASEVTPAGYQLQGAAVIVRMGCTHDYETLDRRNCYIKQRCRLCSHTYAVDSGD